MKFGKVCARILGVAMLGVLAQPATASLIGDSVTSVYQSTNVPGTNLWDRTLATSAGTPIAALVGAGTEYSVAYTSIITGDLGADSLTIGITSAPLGLGGNVTFDFFDLDSLAGAIASVSLVSSDFTGLTFSWTGDSIRVQFPNQVFTSAQNTANFSISFQQQQVPEPATLALVLMGAAGLGFSRFARLRGMATA